MSTVPATAKATRKGGEGGSADSGCNNTGAEATVAGFDCSGLALYAVYQGTDHQALLPRTTEQQVVASGGTIINGVGNAQPGDLVFFERVGTTDWSHVGIYAGNSQVVNAYDFKNDGDNGTNNEYWGVMEMPLTWWAAHYTTRIVRFWHGLGQGEGLTEGSFIRVAGSSTVYRVVGGAPLAVNRWSAVGGQQPVQVISQAQFDALRTYPANGTFINAVTSEEKEQGSYVIAGGAPMAITNGGVYGSQRSGVVRVDAWDVEHTGNPAAHLNSVPADGTFINAVTSEKQEQGSYVIAGGAPMAITNWGVYGSQPSGVVRVDAWDVEHTGNPAAHLNSVPADGTILRAGLGLSMK